MTLSGSKVNKGKAPLIKFELFDFDNPPSVSIKRGELIPSIEQDLILPSHGISEEFGLNEVNEIKV